MDETGLFFRALPDRGFAEKSRSCKGGKKSKQRVTIALKDDIWNMDETGLFFRALPDRGFAEKSWSCKGGKKSKQRVTIALFVSASGHKEKPVFIWKSENPRCLRGFDKSHLPVTFYSQSKAWMSGEILEDIDPH